MEKKSIFFDLPYWSDHHVRHCIDVMHMEKNVCDSLIGTLLNIKGKTKDGLKCRQDLVDMGIRQVLHPISKGPQTYLPPSMLHNVNCREEKFLSMFAYYESPTRILFKHQEPCVCECA